MARLRSGACPGRRGRCIGAAGAGLGLLTAADRYPARPRGSPGSPAGPRRAAILDRWTALWCDPAARSRAPCAPGGEERRPEGDGRLPAGRGHAPARERPPDHRRRDHGRGARGAGVPRPLGAPTTTCRSTCPPPGGSPPRRPPSSSSGCAPRSSCSAPLLARCGHARVSLPGGDDFGDRPVNFHLEGLARDGRRRSRRPRLRRGRVDAGGRAGSAGPGSCSSTRATPPRTTC